MLIIILFNDVFLLHSGTEVLGCRDWNRMTSGKSLEHDIAWLACNPCNSLLIGEGGLHARVNQVVAKIPPPFADEGVNSLRMQKYS